MRRTRLSTHSEELARSLLDIITEDLLGRGARFAEVSEEMPRNLFPAGNLGPSDTMGERLEDFRITEYSPSSIGLVVQCLEGKTGTLEISAEFSVFFPLTPTLSEARAVAKKNEPQLPWPSDWGALTSAETEALQLGQIKFRPKYVRRSIRFESTLHLEEI